MAKPKKVIRKTPAKRKTNTGGLKQTNLNFLSWKILVPALVLFAAVGGYYVSQSFAASWFSVDRDVWPNNSLVVKSNENNSLGVGVNLSKGKTYRFCVRGRNFGGSRSDATLSFNIESPTYRRGVASSKKSYGKSSELHCSKTFYASKNHRATGNISVRNGSNAVIVDASSIDVLR